MNHAPNNHEVIVSGIHLDLTPSLKFYVNEKLGRLFRHEERIVRIRVELESDGKNDVTCPFIAKDFLGKFPHYQKGVSPGEFPFVK